MIDRLVKPEETLKEEWITPEVQLMEVNANTLLGGPIPDPNEGDPSDPDPLGS